MDRSGSGAATSGAISRQTDRPPILPNKSQDAFADTLRTQVTQFLTQPAVFAQLPPELQRELDAISANEQARNAQQAKEDEGRLLAALYANRTNQSSVANELAGQFSQYQNLVRQQQASDAAQRALGLRQYLTDLNQQQGQTGVGLFANLSSLSNARDIAGGGLALDQQRLAESQREFDLSHYLQTLQQRLEQQKFNASNSPFAKTLQTINAVAGLGAGAAGGLSAYRALSSRAGAIPAPNLRLPAGFPSTTFPSNPANYPWPYSRG